MTVPEEEEAKMFEIGRLCVKVAGRDAGKKCVIIDVLDAPYVVIDGQTRRRKCNTKHLEPLESAVKIKKNAPHEDVVEVLKEHGVEVKEKKSKEAKAEEKPKKRAVKEGKEKKPKKAAKEKAVKKKAEKKE